MENPNNPIGSGNMDACEHDKRFAGVFDLPADCHGCLACYAEKLAAGAEILAKDYVDMKALSDHKEILLGKVWDYCRDNNMDYRGRISAVMAAIREKPSG